MLGLYPSQSLHEKEKLEWKGRNLVVFLLASRYLWVPTSSNKLKKKMLFCLQGQDCAWSLASLKYSLSNWQGTRWVSCCPSSPVIWLVLWGCYRPKPCVCVCVCVCPHMHLCTHKFHGIYVEVKGQFVRISSLLLYVDPRDKLRSLSLPLGTFTCGASHLAQPDLCPFPGPSFLHHCSQNNNDHFSYIFGGFKQ